MAPSPDLTVKHRYVAIDGVRIFYREAGPADASVVFSPRRWVSQTFREDRENETEFMTISYWESVEAVSRFTGGDPTKVHHLERDREFLIELPKEVQILRLLTSHGVTGSTW
jgi:hypothetical protein